jgi:hypothetical protein
VDAQHTFATIAAAAAAVAGLAYLARSFAGTTRRMLAVSDVILGREGEHLPLAQRLDSIEHELHTNNGSSLRDVADRLEQVQQEMKTDLLRNAEEGRQRRTADREVIDQLAARVNSLCVGCKWHRNP